jgi:tetratricopeptide (TPR) repeat protein
MEFSAAAVAAGIEAKTEDVEEYCAGLAQQGRFLRMSGTAEWPDGTIAARYSFLHALYQEVLYNRITAGRRQRMHQRIGEREEQAYGERAPEMATELAMHFAQGRDYHKAVHYLQRAGETAVRRAAYQEAVAHITTGLQLLPHLSDTPDRMQQELRLQLTLGPALISLKGMTAPEVERTYARAAALCQLGERPDQLVEVLAGLRAFHLVRGEMRQAREVAEQRLRLVQRVAPRTVLVLAHNGVGEVLSFLGELPTAREHLEQAWQPYSAPEHNGNNLWDWKGIGVSVLSRLATTLCVMGYPNQAQQRFEGSLTLAEEFAHPASLAYVWCNAGWFHALHGDWQDVREYAEAAITLATEQGFPYWLAYGTGLRGRALVEQGQIEEGIALLQRGLDSFQSIGAELGRLADHLPWLATAYAKGGRVEEGLNALDEALALVGRTGTRSGEAELYRLKGELTLQQLKIKNEELKIPRAKGKGQAAKGTEHGAGGKEQKSERPNPQSQLLDPHDEAEVYFLKAIDIARQQHAKLFELRAATGLAGLWRSQGKRRHAHLMLSEVYSWFTEGFDTKDLREARALPTEL